MKRVDDLKEGDYIAFPFKYLSSDPEEIMVSSITSVHENTRSVLVHFLNGHHSVGEWVKLDDILAIGNSESGESKLKGWSGKFDVVNKGHYLIREQNG